MAYTINKFDGNILTTITDGSLDSSSTNLNLPGPNYVGYGEKLDENLVYLLENFAGPTAPAQGPNLIGQIWFNTEDQSLQVFTNQGYVPVAGVKVQGSQPAVAKVGDQWFNTTTNQIYVYDDTDNWRLISPLYTKAQGMSGALPVTVGDAGSTGVTHDIVKLQFGTTTIAVFSKDIGTFVPTPAITGFPFIYPGLTINADLIAGAQQFYTNSNTAIYLPTDPTIIAINANVTAANAAIVTANSSVVNYANSLNSAMIANVTAANTAIVTANSSVVSFVNTVNNNLSIAITANTNAANAAIITANNAVVSQIGTVNLATNAAMLANVNAANIAITSAWTANAASQQSAINTLQTQTYSNTKVAAYMLTNTAKITAETQAKDNSSTAVATTAFVYNHMPAGIIVMWNSTAASIPTGWQLCNGTNGTPDLRDRFVVGATNIYSPGATGGSKDAVVVSHTHAGSTDVADVSHTHTYSGTTSGVGDHVHAEQGVPGQSTPNGSITVAAGYGGGPAPVGYDTAAAGAHSHTYSGTTASGSGPHAHPFTTNATGVSGTNANLPPYYALCYIQKMAAV